MKASIGRPMTVFVNDHALALAEGATLRDALRLYDRRVLDDIAGEAAEVMDSGGWPLNLDARAEARQRVYVCLLPWAERARGSRRGGEWSTMAGD